MLLCSYEEFYSIWKQLVDTREILVSWGFPRTKDTAAIDAAVTMEWRRRSKEFLEVRESCRRCDA